MNAQEMAHVYGYIRASTDKQIASPETQRQIIEEYARRLGKTVDRCFVDPATSGKKRLHDRTAGRELMTTLRTRDTVIVARLDRLSRSFIGFAQILDAVTRKGSGAVVGLFWWSASGHEQGVRIEWGFLRTRNCP
jgi:DNA invertase Pin-like site-specific DNA recombinase